tara:strand:- start:115 stop:294 length:180 start_codon:yes stop_codon:yes gene_type:complete
MTYRTFDGTSQVETLTDGRYSTSGALTIGSLTITALPTSASGLAAGDLWRDGTTVKIVT